MHSTSSKCGLHFVYIFRADWNFLIKFSGSDPIFSRNSFRSLYVKFKTLLRFIYKSHDMIWMWNLHQRYILINEFVNNFINLITWLFVKMFSGLSVVHCSFTKSITPKCQFYSWCKCWHFLQEVAHQKVTLAGTHLDVVRGLIKLRGFNPVYQQEERVGAMLPRSIRTNGSCLC